MQGNSQHSALSTQRSGTVLAFDFGEKRIGVAVGDLAVRLAHPIATVRADTGRRRFDEIAALIREWQPVMLVVGLPTHADGIEHALTRLARRFARQLGGRFGIETVLVDERFTSDSASHALRESGVTGKNQKPLLDQVAAQHILQTFFDQHHATA